MKLFRTQFQKEMALAKERAKKIEKSLNEHESMESMYEMANDMDPDVRASVARNDSLPVELSYLLFKDSEPAVRANLAWNKGTPKEILTELARDKDEVVRWAVCDNESSPIDALLYLLNSEKEEEHLKKRIERNPVYLQYLSDKEFDCVNDYRDEIANEVDILNSLNP
ncbi:MAG: HEAT repeat domain-containing protein [Methyloprofundus sp.]|nr:HEAT repeat domain-containing protein [Methyloprofundus sp.]